MGGESVETLTQAKSEILLSNSAREVGGGGKKGGK